MTIATPEQYAAYATRTGLTAAPAGLGAVLELATEAIQNECRRVFLPSPETAGETETRSYWGGGTRSLYIHDALTVAATTLNGNAVSCLAHIVPGATCYGKLVHSALPDGIEWGEYQGPYVYGSPQAQAVWLRGCKYEVTGRFGYSEQAALPATLVEVCCGLAALELNVVPTVLKRAQAGVSRVQAINITVETKSPANDLQQIRSDLLKRVHPYRRNILL